MYSISKNLWLKSLRNGKSMVSLQNKDNEYLELLDPAEEGQENEGWISVYINRLIAKIPQHCQKIVQYMFYQNNSVEKVAQKWGIIIITPQAM